MSKLDDIVEYIELHDVDGIGKCFESGLDPNSLFRNEPLIYELTSEYTRGPRFKDCVKTFIDHGLKFEDKALLAVLANDPTQLQRLISADKQLVSKRYSLRCAYTPLHQATLLHICAEFDHVEFLPIVSSH